jgi:hypothetical protein
MQISSIRLTDAGRREAVQSSVGCPAPYRCLLASRPRVGHTEEGLSEMHIIPLPCRSPWTQVAASLPIRPICEVRPLRSTGVTPLPHYYEPVRLPTAADAQLWFPTRRCAAHAAAHHVGSPRTLDHSVDARPPLHPGRLHGCRCSLLPRGWQASPNPEGWPPPLASRGPQGFAYAGLTSSRSREVAARSPVRCRTDRSVSRRQLPFDARPTLHAERAIHMADSFQSARVARVGLAQPDYARIKPALSCRTFTAILGNA